MRTFMAIVAGMGLASAALADSYAVLQVSSAKSKTIKENCDYVEAIAVIVGSGLKADCQDTEVGFRAALGFKARDNLNIEVGLQKIGEFEASISDGVGYEKFTDDILGLDVALVGDYPLGNSDVSFQPRLGLMIWKIDATYSTNTGFGPSYSDNVDGISPVLGLGLGLKQFFMNAELIKDVGTDDINKGVNYQGDVTRFSMGFKF